MVAMFGQAPRVNKNVVDIYQDKTVEILSEHLMHEILEYGALTRPYGLPSIHSGR